jgi:hypothetical protein
LPEAEAVEEAVAGAGAEAMFQELIPGVVTLEAILNTLRFDRNLKEIRQSPYRGA